ncbi:MAG: hypothetical protein IJ733_15000, partial [Lachnospiraceae bacterium]|nr:hypothetical protein [Lachnospiraceae bacterium]
MLEKRTASRKKRPKYIRAAYASAAAILLFLSGNVISYAATGNTLIGHLQRTTFFFASKKEADTAKKADKIGVTGGLHGLLDDDTDRYRIDTDEKYQLIFTIPKNSTLISDETGSSKDVWTRRLILEQPVSENGQARIRKESYSGRDAAELISVHPLLKNRDLSWLSKNYTPDEKEQFLILYSDKDHNPFRSILDADYTGDGEESFHLWCTYEPDFSYGKNYLNEKEWDFHEYYTTKDGIEIPI